MSRTINIIKTKGDILHKETIFSRLESILYLLKNGEHELTVKKKVKKRSNNQNAMMWMWYACISQETGSQPHEIHDYYCSKFLIKYIDIAGIQRKVVGGTSSLDTVAMANFLNNVQADAATEFGITLPSPEDQNWESFKTEYERYGGY